MTRAPTTRFYPCNNPPWQEVKVDFLLDHPHYTPAGEPYGNHPSASDRTLQLRQLFPLTLSMSSPQSHFITTECGQKPAEPQQDVVLRREPNSLPAAHPLPY